MPRRMAAQAAVLLIAGWAWGDAFKVTTTANGGAGSLRWAITGANGHAGPDRIVFAAALMGKWILPKKPLPAITDAYTKILGDRNGDGLPDIVLSGAKAGPGNGLTIKADSCEIEGLAIVRFQGNGISLWRADSCVIRYCHVGVNRPGTKIMRNGEHQIKLWRSNDNTIGRESVGGRNVIAAGSVTGMRSGIYIANSSGNRIKNNNIGVTRDGTAALSGTKESGVGITLTTRVPVVPSDLGGDLPRDVLWTGNNLIGGREGDRNVIGGMRIGIDIRQAHDNLVSANYLGVARDGTTPVAIGHHALRIHQGSQGNRVGPQRGYPERRNVISSNSVGVHIQNEGTDGNTVDGNYFGWNAPGTGTLPMHHGIICVNDAGNQTISGNTFGGRFEYGEVIGIYLSAAGATPRVEGNRFLRSADWGMYIIGAGANVVGNRFTRNQVGINCWDVPSALRVRRNSFSGCETAVNLDGESWPNLGVASGDAGLNRFIRNLTDNTILAEGNRFPGGLLDPQVKIWDRKDDQNLGVVDIYPVGSSLPTPLSSAALAVSGTRAAATGVGAEIAFTLSAQAEVTASVLNIAGRPVATICRGRECEAGTHRLLWNACADSGLKVPSGRYVVQVRARGAEGAEATALTTILVGP